MDYANIKSNLKSLYDKAEAAGYRRAMLETAFHLRCVASTLPGRESRHGILDRIKIAAELCEARAKEGEVPLFPSYSPGRDYCAMRDDARAAGRCQRGEKMGFKLCGTFEMKSEVNHG